MSERQKTLGAIVGMDENADTAPHREDFIECSDGSVLKHKDVIRDCRGGAHSNKDDCHDADVEIVTEILTGVDGWVTDYCTGNSDYASMYDHIVSEMSHNWPDRVEEWIRDNYGCRYGHTIYDDCMKNLVDAICNELDGEYDAESESNPNEYARYSGSGCCLFSMDIGEYEEQTEIIAFDELQTLHDDNRLDDVLDYVNCDAYVSRDKRRVKNEKTGCYESVGRETYMPYGSEHPCLITYHMPGGQWQWVVDKDRMEELLVIAIIELCKKKKS